MKSKILILSAMLATGCASPRAEYIKAKAEMDAILSANPFEWCLPVKSQSELVMKMRQDGKSADHIFYDFGQKLSPQIITAINGAFAVPMSYSKIGKAEAVKTFANSQYMNCVAGLRSAQEQYK